MADTPSLTWDHCCALIGYVQRQHNCAEGFELGFGPEDVDEDEPGLREAYLALDDLTGGEDGLTGARDALVPASRHAAVEAERDEARAEAARHRADLHTVWGYCTGIVSTAAEGPDVDNIPRRVREMRKLALQPMEGPPTKPGWYVVRSPLYVNATQVVHVWSTARGLRVFMAGDYYDVDAREVGRWLARIPVESVEPPGA